jgi:hypothetical protein
MANVLIDALSKPDQLDTGAIQTEELDDAAASGSKVSREYAPTFIGSPVAIGNLIQAGQATLGAGSTVWVTFGRPFKGTPRVVAVPADSTLHYIATGSANLGSFFAIGAVANKVFDWIAIGSGI